MNHYLTIITISLFHLVSNMILNDNFYFCNQNHFCNQYKLIKYLWTDIKINKIKLNFINLFVSKFFIDSFIKINDDDDELKCFAIIFDDNI